MKLTIVRAIMRGPRLARGGVATATGLLCITIGAASVLAFLLPAAALGHQASSGAIHGAPHSSSLAATPSLPAAAAVAGGKGDDVGGDADGTRGLEAVATMGSTVVVPPEGVEDSMGGASCPVEKDVLVNAGFFSLEDAIAEVPGGENGDNYANADLTVDTAIQQGPRTIVPPEMLEEMEPATALSLAQNTGYHGGGGGGSTPELFFNTEEEPHSLSAPSLPRYLPQHNILSQTHEIYEIYEPETTGSQPLDHPIADPVNHEVTGMYSDVESHGDTVKPPSILDKYILHILDMNSELRAGDQRSKTPELNRAPKGLDAGVPTVGAKEEHEVVETTMQTQSRKHALLPTNMQVVQKPADHPYRSGPNKSGDSTTKLLQLALAAEDPVPPYWAKPSRRQGTLKNQRALLNNVVKSSQPGIAAALFGMTSFLVLGPKGLVMAGGLYLAGALPTSAAASSSSGKDDCGGDATDNITWTLFNWFSRILMGLAILRCLVKLFMEKLGECIEQRRVAEALALSSPEEADASSSSEEKGATPEEANDEETGRAPAGPAALPSPLPAAGAPARPTPADIIAALLSTLGAVCNVINTTFFR